jgi:hypothetical protein
VSDEPYTFARYQAGEKPPAGWDAADAEGWTDAQLLAFVRRNVVELRPGDGESRYDTSKQWGLGLPWTLNANNKPDRKSLWNGHLVLKHSPDFKGLFAYDAFRRDIIVTRKAPLDGPAFRYPRVYNPKIDNGGIAAAMDWLAGMKLSPTLVEGIVLQMARENQFDSAQDWMTRLPEHDGHTNHSELFIEHGGAEDTPYNRAVARKMLIALWARVLWKPGQHPVKYDHMVILEGDQGVGKTSLIEALADDGRYYKRLDRDFAAKDTLISISTALVVEVAELGSLLRSKNETSKAFLTASSDHWRPLYEPKDDEVPRRCIFIGSTNPGYTRQYLSDQTGNRRFLPVELTRDIDMAALRRDLPQYHASALQAFLAGEPWWFTPDEARTLLLPEQEERTVMPSAVPYVLEAGDRRPEFRKGEFTFKDMKDELGFMYARDKVNPQNDYEIYTAFSYIGIIRLKKGRVKGHGVVVRYQWPNQEQTDDLL